MFTSLHVEGNLISEELLQLIALGKATGQETTNFGLEPGSRLNTEIEYSWSRIRLEWKRFSEKRQVLSTVDPYATSLTRRWMEDFFKTLGFEMDRVVQALEGSNGQRYNISHTARNPAGLPIHVVGFVHPDSADGREVNTLDVRSSGGTSRLSPHSTVQEYLNVTDQVYGLVTNGLQLRLLRDSARLVKFTYIEFDLHQMLEQDQYADFTLLYRLLHNSRFGTADTAENSWLEVYYRQSIETGNRIRDGLSKAVEESLLMLGNGFLTQPDNEVLRRELKDQSLNAKEYYRELLRLVYRLLFLLVTEERDLVYDPDDKSESTGRHRRIYRDYYSLNRLRRLSELRYLDNEGHTDLWPSLQATFRLFEEAGNGPQLGLQPLGGDLFSTSAIPHLAGCTLSNRLLLQSLRNMSEFRDTQARNLVPINYRALDVEELGSVYEGLLDLHPIILPAQHISDWRFTFHQGTDRKTTGSYYTRQDLVNELIKSALIPVIEERLQSTTGNREKKAKALLALKVCDPATGSGHMLLSAARTIAWYLARVQSGDENPGPSVYRGCLRQVIQHCIYAVDYNPDAVELCKLALWLESHNSGKPLSFLDHKIRIGNSLVGVTDLSVLTKPLPDEAFASVAADAPAVCRELKKSNTQFRKTKQTTLFSAVGQQLEADRRKLQEGYAEMETIEQDSLNATHRIAKRFLEMRQSISHEEQACNIWTAAFFKTYTDAADPSNPSSEKLARYFREPGEFEKMAIDAMELKKKYKFFHWPLEFPDVWEQGGFDVMLGNPPWERIKLQQQEFFATRDARIAGAPDAAARNRLIDALSQSNPSLYHEYFDAVHGSDATGKFLRGSGRCELTAVGDINTYSIFAELFSSLINNKGRAGFIVPTGIATDDSNKTFFSDIVEKNKLISLFDFENRENLFPDVHSAYKFCLLTIAGHTAGDQPPRFGFFLTQVVHLQDRLRTFSLSKEDFIRLNPNTKTCPVFRTSVDAELTKKIYRRVPVLVNEITDENHWQIRFEKTFDGSLSADLLFTKEKLEEKGLINDGIFYRSDTELFYPVYEGKMVQMYDHRAANVIINRDNLVRQAQPEVVSELGHQDPNIVPKPQYWINDVVVKASLDASKKWFLGIKKVTSPTNERTFVSAIIPFRPTTYSFKLLSWNEPSPFIVGNLNSLIFDYIARIKIGGVNLAEFIINQLPALSPSSYSKSDQIDILTRVLELTYSSWDIKTFADDLWQTANETLKGAVRDQWRNNALATGGHTWAPNEWCTDHGLSPEETNGFPFPPFKWDEERRAIIKAELDAIFAKLYGLTTEELRYILDPQDVYGPDFPGETFRVLKEKEIRQFGEYRTKRLVLEAWERL